MSSTVRPSLLPKLAPVRAPHRWALASVTIVTIALGWRFPVLGFIVPVAMAAGVVGAFFKGRYVCGNICPRGSFFDTFFRLVGGRRPVPAWMKGMPFRWGVLAFLMSFMAWQISGNPGDPMHWGKVFWMACALTTAVGVVLGTIYRPRTWCSFCPVGTMANAIGGDRYLLRIGPDCKKCNTCERSCPMDLSISAHKAEGVVPNRDCIKCGACVAACPRRILSFPDAPTLQAPGTSP